MFHFEVVSVPFKVLGLAAVVLTVAGPALAIECNKGYQRVQGQDLATPYCQDNYLAEVARSFGVRTSAEAIRNNPSTKREVCRLVGRDIRVQSNCASVDGSGRGGRF
jgi:hypothetical protein